MIGKRPSTLLTVACVLSIAAAPSRVGETSQIDDVRFFVYSNEYDVEGMIAATSVWPRDKVRPEGIRERVETFGQVRRNLVKHAPDYPTMEHLLSVIKAGLPEFGMKGGGPGKDSEGSRHIIDVIDRLDDRPIWISVWGGANCLAQPLRHVKDTRSQADPDAFVSGLRVYTIPYQDDSGRWLRATFPGRTVPLNASGSYDPDGDAVSCRWFVYREAGTYEGDVPIAGYLTQRARFAAPKIDSPKSIHVILGVKDDGAPSLFACRRIMGDVQP